MTLLPADPPRSNPHGNQTDKVDEDLVFRFSETLGVPSNKESAEGRLER